MLHPNERIPVSTKSAAGRKFTKVSETQITRDSLGNEGKSSSFLNDNSLVMQEQFEKKLRTKTSGASTSRRKSSIHSKA